MNAHKEDGDFSSAVEKYYLGLIREDSSKAPGPNSRLPLLQDVLDAKLQYGWRHLVDKVEGPGWKPKKILGQGGFGKVILWEKARKGRQLCCIEFLNMEGCRR